MNDISILQNIERILGFSIPKLSENELNTYIIPSYYSNELDRIISLNLSDIDAKVFDFLLKDLIYLEKLTIVSAKLTDIQFLEFLPNLIYLNLTDNNIQSLASISNCKLLNTLILAENKISDILPLKKLTSLVHLDLHTNKIFDISPISELKYMSILDLRENEITDVSAVAKMHNLTNLNLYNNDIESINPVSNLLNLTHFSAGLNHIRDISALAVSLNLQYLNLRDNKISDISFLKKLVNLKKLNLWDNNIKNVDDLANLTQLTYLNLSENQIHNIDSLSFLVELKILSLEKNEIVDISKLKELKKLEKLDVRYNRIKKLTFSLAENLPDIVSLDTWDYEGINLYNNPLEFPPIEIVKQKKQAVLNFFSELHQAKETDCLNEVKLILIGEDRAGKSSLADALSNPNYKFHDKPTTQGINIIKWILPTHEFANYTSIKALRENPFRVNIWDFGGQEIYHATHQFFLTRHSVYLLVIEARRDIQHVDFFYWLNIIKVLSSNSPVVIVLNKIDLPTKSLPIANYQEKFPNVLKYKEVSCLDDYNYTINSLREEIKKIVFTKNLLPEIGISLPKVWVEIRHRLDKLKQEGNNYIDLNLYFEICADYGMPQERALFLSGYFHQIGVFLHFQEDVHLNDTIFLNHEWVTSGVYAVLDDVQTIKNRGKFTNSDLIRIWNSNGYQDKRSELLSLMHNERFSICFELSEGVFLVPQLLSEEPIDYEWNNSDQNLQFEFRYDFMPKGILTQFIAKSQTEIVGENYWRFGVLLEYENTRAIVIEYYFEKKIKIKLAGENGKDFLGIIRKNLKEINRNFYDLQVIEMIPCNCKHCISSETPHFYNYTKLKERLKRGKATIECYNSYENVNIYTLLYDVGTQSAQIDDIVFLISKNELDKAIELLLIAAKNDDESTYNQVIMVSAKFNSLKNQMIEGTLSQEEIDLQKSQIRKSLLTIINQYRVEI